MRRSPGFPTALGIILASLMLAGCTLLGADRNSDDIINGIGTIRWIKDPSGFYGIISDDNWKLEPVDLPETFRADYMRVLFKVRANPKIASIHSWGTGVEVLKIERLSDDYNNNWTDAGPDPPKTPTNN